MKSRRELQVGKTGARARVRAKAEAEAAAFSLRPGVGLGIVVLLAIVCGLSAKAHAKPFAAIGSQVAFEYAANGRTIETRQPWALRAGYRFGKRGDAYLEYARGSDSQGTGSLSVERTRQEWLAWGRRIFDLEWKMNPYVSAGLGAQFDTIETSMGTMSREVAGRPRAIAAIGGGFHSELTSQILFDLESKLAFSNGYARNPQLSFSLLFGWGF